MKNQRKLGFILSYINIFISSVSGIVFTPYMISRLGSTEYGLYQLLYATIGYVALLDFGLGSTLTRFILKFKQENNKEKIDSVTTMCMKLYCTIGLVVFIIVWLLSLNLEVLFTQNITSSNVLYARKLLMIMGATTSVSFVSHALHGVMTAYERYAVSKGLGITKQLLRIFAIIVMIELNFGSLAIVISDFVLSVFMAIFDVIYCKIALNARIFIGKWDTKMFKSLFSFSVFVFMQIIVTQINNGLDRVVLGMYGTLELVALYGVAFQLYNLFNSIGGVVIGVTLPQISTVVFSGGSVREITDCCAKYSRYQLHILAPIISGFIVLGRQFISLWAPDYNSTHMYFIVLLIVIPQILESVEGTIFNVMKAKNLQATRSIILIFVAVLHVLLSISLVKLLPVYGTAIGTFVSFVIGNNIISNIYYHKKVGVNMFSYFRQLFKGILPTMIMAILIGAFISMLPISGWGGLLVKVGVYALVYCLLICLFGMTKDEKNILKKLLCSCKILKCRR